MTPEEITAMAEKMAICFSADSFEFTNDGLLAFAALVAEKAAAKKVEECALIADAIGDKWGGIEGILAIAKVSDAIRARGQKGGV